MTNETETNYPMWESPIPKPREGYLGIILPSNPDNPNMVVIRQTRTFGLHSLKMPKFLHDTLLAWWRIDVPIQSTALGKELDATKREFLISGMPPNIQKRVFNPWKLGEDVLKQYGKEKGDERNET